MEVVRKLARVAVPLALMVGACGGDDESTPSGAVDAAVAAEAAPDVKAEAAVDAPAESSAPDASGADATADGGGDAPVDVDADAVRAYGLFVASNYADRARLAVLDLETLTAAGTTLDVASGDVIPYASGKRGFLLDRAGSRALVLDRAAPWTVARTIDVKGDGAASANPYAAIISTGAKTYVLRYGTNVAFVVEANTGAVTGTIDLSSFVGSGDPDGFVDSSDGVYDPSTGRVYVLLQRIDQFGWNNKLDHLLPCLPFAPLLIAIDAATDQIVDLGGGDAGGKGIALLGQNPAALVPDLAAGRLLFVDRGCYDTVTDPNDGGVTEPRRLRGIESLTLATGTSAWLYQYDQSDRLEGLVLANATHAFVDVEDTNFVDHWYAWNPTTSSLGAEIASFPSHPVHHAGKVFGIAATTMSDGGTELSIVAHDVASGQTDTMVLDAFHDAAMGYASGSAIIR